MTEPEFFEWLDYHCTAFDTIAKYFENAATPDVTKRMWFNTLCFFSLQELKDATDEMFADEELQPMQHSKHPSRIRKIANKLRKRKQQSRRTQFVDGEPVYDCQWCKDEGLVSVIHPDTIRDLKSGLRFEWPRGENGRRLTSDGKTKIKAHRMCVSVRCVCGAGQRDFRNSEGIVDIPQFKPSEMVLGSTRIEELEERFCPNA